MMKTKYLIWTLMLTFILSIFVIGAAFKEVPMTLQIGNQPPRFISVELNDPVTGDDEMDLVPGDTANISCSAEVFELDGFQDLINATAVIWNYGNGGMYNYEDSPNNIYHYYNDSCNWSELPGYDDRNALINCTFNVLFYANYSDWNCTITINDTFAYAVNGTDNATMNRLVAINSANATIDWGTRSVDTEYDSNLNVSIQNEGNVELDIEIDAYNNSAIGSGDNYSFGCDIGAINTSFISYNLTSGGSYADSSKLLGVGLINESQFNLSPQVSGLMPSNSSVYFGINIPSMPTINGSCTGFMRFNGYDGSS